MCPCIDLRENFKFGISFSCWKFNSISTLFSILSNVEKESMLLLSSTSKLLSQGYFYRWISSYHRKSILGKCSKWSLFTTLFGQSHCLRLCFISNIWWEVSYQSYKGSIHGLLKFLVFLDASIGDSRTYWNRLFYIGFKYGTLSYIMSSSLYWI